MSLSIMSLIRKKNSRYNSARIGEMTPPEKHNDCVKRCEPPRRMARNVLHLKPLNYVIKDDSNLSAKWEKTMKYPQESFDFSGIFAKLAMSFEGGFSSPHKKIKSIY